MDREELISKKELLLATGISYGQLYRWKRQRLLPDSWFIKMSSYTGQETYFPRAKVLERIRSILDLKDTHSLDELAELFGPAGTDRSYSLLDVREAMKLSVSIFETSFRLLGRSGVSFSELVLIDLFAELERRAVLTSEELAAGLSAVAGWSTALAGAGEKRVILFRKQGVVSCILLEGRGMYRLDAGSEKIGEYDMAERAKELRFKLAEAMVE